MNRTRRIPLFRLTVTALAVLVVLAIPRDVRAEDAEADATVDVGFGLLSGSDADRALFGQHNGLRQRDAVVLLGLEYERRQPETGTVIRFEGIDLLGGTREVDLRWKRQGDWALKASYAEWVRHDPLETSTGDELKVERTRLGVTYSKIIDPRWQLSVSLQSEDKKGSRLFGVGFNCPSAVAPDCGPTTGTEVGWAVLIRPEPIDANHSQVDARVTYAAGALAQFGKEAEGSVGPIAGLLKDSNPNVRLAAARVLGELGPYAEKAVPALNEALDDESGAVTVTAIDALGRIGEAAAAVLASSMFTRSKRVHARPHQDME